MLKKIFSLLLLLAVALLQAKTVQKLLANGMIVVAKENKTVPTIAMNCLVKTGSIHEGRLIGAGMSHYLEHLVSGGTTSKRTEADYKKIMREIGAESNASTNYYMTDYYLSADSRHASQILSMLAEYMQFSVLDSNEVNREKEVIQKEIIMRTTDPSSRCYFTANEILFQQSPQKYPVIGYLDLFNKVTRKDLLDYYHARYAPNNMIFTAVGNFDADSMLLAIEKQFSTFPRGFVDPRPVADESFFRVPAAKKIKSDLKLAQCYSYKHIPDLLPIEENSLDVIHYILFGKRTSLLTYRLTEELKLVNWIWGNVHKPLPEGGSSLAQITFEPKNPADIELIREKIWAGFAEVIKDKKLAEKIVDYRRHIEASIHLSKIDPTEEAAQINRNVYFYNTPKYQEEVINVISTLTPADLIAAVNKYILNGPALTIDFLPKDYNSDGQAKELTEKNDLNFKALSPDLTLIHFKNSAKPVIEGRITLPVSTYQEDYADAGLMEYTAGLIFNGSKNYAPLYLADWLQTHQVQLNTTVSHFGTSINFRCLKEDYPELQKILLDGWKNPLFDNKELEFARDNFKEQIKRQSVSPDYQHENFRNKIIYQGQGLAQSDEELLSKLEKMKSEDYKKIYNKYFKADKFAIALTGDLTQNEAVKLAEELAAKMKNGNNGLAFTPVKIPALDSTYVNRYQSVKVNLLINFQAPLITDTESKAFTVLNAILSGGTGRLHEASRGQSEGLAYFAGSYYSYGPQHSFFRIYSQTSADKKERLLQVLKGEVDKLQRGELTAGEIVTAIDEYMQSIRNYTTDENRAFIALDNFSKGLGYDYYDRLENELKRVTVEDIQRVAVKYLSKQAVIISEPEKN